MSEAPPITRLPRDFWHLFGSDTASSLGSAVSVLAIQLLLIHHLHASAAQVGAVRSAQWLPYLAFGLVAGVWADRWRRRPVLITCDLASAAVMATVATLAIQGTLTVPILCGLVFCAGTITCLSVAAHQSFVPRLVPERQLPAAFARMAQSGSVVSSTGPLISGALVRALGSPVAVVVDAVSYLVSAGLLARIRTAEPVADPGERRTVRDEVAEGARWVYRHPLLRPYALWLHSWFFCFTLVNTVLVYLASVELRLGPLTVGAILAVEGASGLLWASLATRLERRFGVGRVVTVVEWTSPLWGLLIALTQRGHWAVPMLVLAQVVSGVGTISMVLMMSHRTAITPDHLRARMNATIRTFNWGGLAISAALAGWLATQFGTRTPIWIGTVGLLVATTYLWLSPYRRAEMPLAPR